MFVFKLILDCIFMYVFCLCTAYILLFGKKGTGVRLDYAFTAIALILYNVLVL